MMDQSLEGTQSTTHQVPAVFSGVMRMAPASACFFGDTFVIGGILNDLRLSKATAVRTCDDDDTYVFAMGCCQ